MRFLPWILGGIGVAALGSGIAAFLFAQSSQDPGNSDDQQVVDQDASQEEIPCETTDTVVLEDQALHWAIRAAITGSEVGDGEPIACDDLASLQELDAKEHGVVSLAGLELAESLEQLNLASNPILVDADALAELDTLQYLNLTDANINDRDGVLQRTTFPTLENLFLAENGIRDISWLSEYQNLVLLSVAFNPIVDLTAIASPSVLQNGAQVYAQGTSLNLSQNSQQREIIEGLKQRGIEVIWDELYLTLGVGDLASRRASIEAPGSVMLVAEPELNDFDNAVQIASVEFYDVDERGVLSSIFFDEEAPYQHTVLFEESEVGSYRFAAEVVTNRGATYLLTPEQYVAVQVEAPEPDPDPEPEVPEPECRQNADCGDANMCTEDSCINGVCQNSRIASCEAEEVSCSDGIDNDRDGEPDCDDTSCMNDPYCAPEPAPPQELACSFNLRLSCHASGDNKYCKLNVANDQCGATLVECFNETCRHAGSAEEFDWEGCDLEQTIHSMQPGEVKEMPGYRCGGLTQLCRGILLCTN